MGKVQLVELRGHVCLQISRQLQPLFCVHVTHQAPFDTLPVLQPPRAQQLLSQWQEDAPLEGVKIGAVEATVNFVVSIAPELTAQPLLPVDHLQF